MAKEKMTLDKLATNLTATVDQLAQITTHGFNDLNDKFISLENRFDGLEQDVKIIKEEISFIHQDTGNIERIQRAEIGRADQHEKRIKILERKVGIKQI